MLQANAGTGRVRRRRFITVGLAALAMAVPSVARAGTTSSSSSDQEVHGVVTYPTGLPRNGGAPVRCAANGQGVPGTTATIASVTPGKSFALTADSGTWEADFDIAFYSAGPVCTGTTAATPLPYRNMGGDEYGVVPANATMAVVSLVSDSQKQAFTYREYVPAPVALRNADQQKPTVVAIIEPLVLLDNLQGKANGFSPYHLDFSGAEHPWNRDGNSQNDIDFTADPSPWLPGYPGATPVQITVPTTADQDVSTLAAGPDKDAWASMQASTPGDVHLYRLPGTKIVGAATFSFAPSSLIQLDTPAIYSPQNLEAHGTKTSSVAAGNIHGSCPECVLVLLRGNAAAAMAWATAQPWIDVISNSYGAAGGFPSADQPTRLRMRDAVTGGQTIVWSSGNGAEGNATVPALDYFDDRPGSDWIVTVGGVEPSGEQPDGASRPVDLASYDISYWSAGGTTAGGQTLFGGTSNAAPVVA
ncbi:MAG: serine protease, partial [Acidimicrobiaceae bacterium]|nr:serine protease [Acidimicrobiaceae bacterium]